MLNTEMPTFECSPLFGVVYFIIGIFALYLIVKLFAYTDENNYGVIFPVMIVVIISFIIMINLSNFDPKTQIFYEKMNQYNNYMGLRSIAKAKLLQETEQKIEEIIKTL